MWVTRPERPKGAKDEVKQARRAQSRPEGPQARSRGPEGPCLTDWEHGTPANFIDSDFEIFFKCTVTWVTRPERLKGAKDEVKQARRAKSLPEGPQTRGRGPEGP